MIAKMISLHCNLKWALGSKGLGHPTDIPPSPQSGASRKKFLSTEKVYEIKHMMSLVH